MKFSSILYFVLIFSFVRSKFINTELVGNYFSHQGVKQITVFACWDTFEKVNFVKNVMKMNLMLSYSSVYSIETNMKSLLKVNYYKLGILLDLDCFQSEKILKELTQFSRSLLPYNETYFWMIITKSNEIPYEILNSLPLSINTEFTLVLEQDKNDYSLYDIYNPSYRHGGKLNVTYLGQWNSETKLSIKLSQYKYKRRGNLHGMYLNFSIVVDYPPDKVDMDTYLTTPIDRHLDTMHRYNYALIMQLRDYYNFTMNLMRGTTWGYKVNGTFNGILGDMVKGIVDVGATPFNWKPERLDVMEYTVQSWVAGVTVILRHPKKNDLSNQFFKPFKREIWIFTVVFAILNWLLLYLTVKVEKMYNAKEIVAMLDVYPASETALITTAALCQQGSSGGSRLYSGRIVFMSLFLWALMLYQFYSASVVGSLLAVPPRFITTPQALLESSMELGAEDIAYNYDFFATSPDPVVAELNRKKLMPNKYRKKASYFKPEEGLKKVQKGGFAFQTDIATAYKIIEDTFNEDEICELQEIRLLPPVHTATGTAKHSPFKKMITYGLRQIVERGTADRLRHVWHHRRPRCPDSHNSLPTPVALKEFSPALFMFSSGLSIAVFVMLTENLIYKYWYVIVQKNRRKITSSSDEEDIAVKSIIN